MPEYYASGTATTDSTWTVWAGSAATDTNCTWTMWVTTSDGGTSEQIAENAETQRRMAEQRAMAQAEQAEANARARELLLAHLTVEQRFEYLRNNAFRLIVGDKTYRIRRGWAGNVDLLDERGIARRRFCIHPRIAVPEEDNMLAQKLLLESNEDEFRRIANESAA